MGDVDHGTAQVKGASDVRSGGLAPGTELGGYTVRRLLGRGAMGAVYEAVDDGGTAVALKVLHAHLDTDPVARQRLTREVSALQRLRHPAVARVLDAELDGEGAFVVTELIDGRTLEAEVDEGGPLDAVDLYELADQLAAALEAVHLAGVVHRDLKPSNVMITANGPVLIDFGIAAALGDGGTTTSALTSPGFVIGTPGYLAPELIAGGDPSPESDWWSWAALLAFAATGRSPFGVRPTDLVLRRSREGRADLVGLPARTARALAGALQADPSVRFGPTQVARALRRDSEEAAFAATLAGDPLAGSDEATQRIVVNPDGGTDREGTRVVGAPTMLVGAPTELVAVTGATEVVPGPAADGEAGHTNGVPAHDGLTQLVPTTTGAVPAVTGGVPVVTGGIPAVTGAIPVGEVRYRPYEAIASETGDLDDDLDDTPAAPPEPYRRKPLRRRAGTVLSFAVPLVVLAATRPGLAFAALAGLIVLCRIAGHMWASLHDRREAFGAKRGSDGVLAVVKAPWHAFAGVVGAIPQLLVAGCVGVLLVVGGFWFFGPGRVILMPRPDIEARAVGGMNETIVFCGVLALAMLVTVLVAWFGPAGQTGRDGARVMLRTFAPGWIGAAVVIALCLVAAWLLAAPLLQPAPVIDWWPFSGPPSL